MPDHQPLQGYYRINRERLDRRCEQRGISSDKELIRRLEPFGVSQSTFYRMLYDRVNPSSSAMYAVATLLDVQLHDIFDAVPGPPPASRPEPSTTGSA